LHDTVEVWVEPTPRVIITPEVDTLCNETYAAITVQIPTVSTNAVKFRFEVEEPEGVYVEPIPDYDLNSGSMIIDSISNTTLSVQKVLFIIYPYTWDANDIERCPGMVDTAVIWINPTPVISVALPSPGDTLYCNGTDVEFSVGTDNGNIIGEKVYEISAVYNVVDVSGVTELPTVPNDNTGFINTLVNSHDSIVQMVTYTITPRFINVASDISECTRGIDTTIRVYIAATLNDTLLSAKVWAGGYDLRCNESQPNYFGQDSAGINLFRWGGFGSFLGTGYDYYWTPATGIDPSAKDQTDLSSGTYSVRISDDVGCFIEDTIELRQPQLYVAKDTFVSRNLCVGGADAIIHVSVEGGNAGYEFTWTMEEDPGFLSKEQSPSNLIKGFYHLDTYDTNRCFNEIDEVEVKDPFRISIGHDFSKYGSYEIACNGDSNGSIVLKYYVGGNGTNWKEFDYEWRLDPADSLPYVTGWEIYDLPANSYYLKIYDSIGCENDYSETPYVLSEPPDILFDSVYIRTYGGIYNIQCYDSLNGDIWLDDNAGAAGRVLRQHFYTWTTNDGLIAEPTSQDQEGLSAGTYYVKVLDQYNCELRDTFTLIQPPPLILSDTNMSNYNGFEITCADSATGWIAVQADSGFYHPADPYTFGWNHLETGNPVAGNDSIYGLVAGHYRLTVTDSLGCYRIDTFSLDQPEQLSVQWQAVDYHGVDISCFGLSDGAIDTSDVAGGIESYTYYWTRESNGWTSTTAQPANLTADVYTLQVTDTNGCITYFTDTLVQPDELLIGELDPEYPTCAGAWNGSITIDTINGGTLPYSILWNTPLSNTTQNVDSLPTGYYTIQVRDVNDCYTIDSAELIEPPPVDGAIDTVSLYMYNNRMISCYGANDAVLALLDPEGGTPPYDFEWYFGTDTSNTFSTEDTVYNRPTGLHTVRMTDAQGCEFTAEIVVTQPDVLTSQSYVSDALCYNDPTGSIDFHMAGGTPPYRYGWFSGQTQPLITELLAGEYYVFVQDTNMCDYDTTLIVGQPDTLQLNAVYENPGCPDDFRGYIQVSPTGGATPYYITWDDGYSGETRTDLGPGLYVAQVTDDHSCITRDSIVLVSDAESCLEIPTAFTPNADGYNDRWIIEGMIYYPDATMRIFNRWGELIYETKNYYDKPWDGRYKGVKVAVDSYHFVINFTNGNKEITGHVTVIK
jgi:gliding motility-associated-like protein